MNASEFADQFQPGKHCAARGNQIIDQQHARTGFDGIGVDFHRSFPVFERVALRYGFKRQLAFFADGDKTDVEMVGECRADNEAARVQTGNDVDFLIHIAVNQ